jgi:SAM-dependent methyltransferase
MPAVSAAAWARVDSFAGNHTSPALSTDRPCPICGSRRSSPVVELSDFQFFTDSAGDAKRMTLREVQCRDCFALFKNPCYSPEGFATLFAEAGCSYGTDRGGEQIAWLAGRGRLRDGARVLDVGCYDGRFLAAMPASVTRTGVDLDAAAIARGRAQFASAGVQLSVGDFESFAYEGRPDTITMLHVLEHLPRPLAALAQLRAIAHDATRLVIEVPTLESAATNDINGYLTPQHLTHFSRRTFDAALRQTGWRPLETIDAADYNGRRIVAAPAAPADPGSGDPADVTAVYTYLAGWYRAIADVNLRCGALATTDRCVVWGGGFHTELLYQLTILFRQRPRDYLIVDSDPLKQGRSWRGVPIGPPEWLRGIDWRAARLVVSSYGSQNAIARAAVDLGVPADRLLLLYDVSRVY